MGERGCGAPVHGAALDGHVGPQQPPAPFRGPARRRPRPAPAFADAAPDEIVEQARQAASLSPPMLFDRQQALSRRRPARRARRAARSRLAFLSSRSARRPSRRGSAARSALRRASARSRRPNRCSSCARDAAEPRPCRPARRTPRSTHVARGGYSSLRVGPGGRGVERPGCGAGRRAADRSAIRASCRPRRSNRARGTAVRVLPNVPVSVRSPMPSRTPTTDGVASVLPSLRRP